MSTYSAKKTVVPTALLTTLLVALISPNVAHGAQGAEDVRVVNGSTESVPVTVSGTPTVNAQQSGTWSVGITGTPTVTVGNATNDAVPVTSVDGTQLIEDSTLTPNTLGSGPSVTEVDVAPYETIRVALIPDCTHPVDSRIGLALLTVEDGVDHSDAPLLGMSEICGAAFMDVYEVPGRTLAIQTWQSSSSLPASSVRILVWGNN